MIACLLSCLLSLLLFYAPACLGRSGVYSVLPWCYVRTCVCAYVTFVTRFKFTCKFRCKFTSAFLLQLITFIPSELESWNFAWHLPTSRLLMYGTVAPGSCPWAALGVGAGASVYCGHISRFFAPNFKEVGGAYCFWVVRPSVRPSFRPSVRSSRFLVHSITLEPWMLPFWNFLYVFLMKKLLTCIFFLTGLCPISELWPFEKIWMQSCQQNISKTIKARALKLNE